MLKQRGSASSGTKPTERKNVEEDYNSRLNKMQKEEYLIKNACYSVTKYYLCKQNNKRSLLGRKQRNQVTRSFLNRYQFSSTNKVTSLFSTSCILRIILKTIWELILQKSSLNRYLSVCALLCFCLYDVVQTHINRLESYKRKRSSKQ